MNSFPLKASLVAAACFTAARAQHNYNVIDPAREPGCFGEGSIACPDPMYPGIACTRGGSSLPCETIDVLINNPESGGWPGGGPMKYVTYGMLKRINEAQELLPGYYVKITYQDDGCDSDTSLQLLVSQLVDNPNRYVAFGGTSCSGTAMRTCAITPLYRLPHVGWAPSSADLSDAQLYQNFFRTRVPDTLSNSVWLEFLRQAGWTKVGIVWGQTARFGFHHLLLLEDLEVARTGSPSWDIEVLWDTQVVILEQDTSNVLSYVQLHRSRVVIALGYAEVLRALMCHGLRKGVQGLVLLTLGWHSADFVQDRSSPDMSGNGNPMFTCTVAEMNDLFDNAALGTNGDLWSSDMSQPIDCVPGMTAASVRNWYVNEGLTGQGYEHDGAIFVNQISAGMDGMCTVLFMLREMLVVRNRTVDQLRFRSQVIYDEIVAVLAGISFAGVSSRRVVFNSIGDLNGGVSIMQTGYPVADQDVGWLALGKYEQGVLLFTEREVHWPDGRVGFADAPNNLFPACHNGSIFLLGVCEPCPAGSYADQGQCVSCDLGTYSSDRGRSTRASCVNCPDGRIANETGMSACLACEAGRFSSSTTTCRACSPGGHSATAGAAACTSCLVGRFNNESGATRCTRCGEGKQNPDSWLTLQSIMVNDVRQWDPTQGADSPSWCGCSAGTYLEDGECIECGRGIACPGFGEVVVLEGYFSTSDRPGFVFECFGDFHRCPGGPPGACAPMRDNTSLACLGCEGNARPSGGGGCVPCQGADSLPFVVVVLVAFALLGVMYWVVDHENHAKQSPAMLLIVISSGQLLTLCQQQGVLGVIALEWPEPFASLLGYFDLLNFNLDVLHLDCVARMDAHSRFVSRVFAVLMVFAAMLVIHTLTVVLFHKAKFKERLPALIGSTGTIFMAFFISIVSSLLAPFQCNQHPSGLRVLRAYPGVTCFEEYSNFDSNHDMLLVGVFAMLIPIGFLTLCIITVHRLPFRMRAGDTVFLHSYAFLFFRFRPGAQWYVIAFLGRNFLMAFTPVLPGALTQVLFLQVILLPFQALTIFTLPWRVPLANALDASATACVIWLLLLAACLIDGADPKVIANLCVVLISLAIAGLSAAIVQGFYLKFARRGKPFQFFLCHHKAGAGNLARLLKMHLKEQPGVTKKVFVDSDNLEDLSQLFGYVCASVDVIVAVCSKEFLTRPWCVGEVTTARVNDVQAVSVLMPDFEWPEQTWLSTYEEHCKDALMLARFGIDIGMVKQSIRWLREASPCIAFGTNINLPSLDLLCTMLLSDWQSRGRVSARLGGQSNPAPTEPRKACVSAQPPSPASPVNVAILADLSNTEAASAAFVLLKLLGPLLQSQPEKMPHILEPGGAVPEALDKLLLICSNGCFLQTPVVRALLQALRREPGVVPVVVEQGFRFPTAQMYQELEREGPRLLAEASERFPGGAGAGGGEWPESTLRRVVQHVFGEIAMEVHPQDSEASLRVRAAAVASRVTGESSTRLTAQVVLSPTLTVLAGKDVSGFSQSLPDNDEFSM